MLLFLTRFHSHVKIDCETGDWKLTVHHVTDELWWKKTKIKKSLKKENLEFEISAVSRAGFLIQVIRVGVHKETFHKMRSK
jgi:hypothetical protein